MSGKPERADILPVGRYWHDFIGREREAIAVAWFEAQGKMKRVRVLATEGANDENGVWRLFEVLQPMPWPQIELGSPTHAGPEIRFREDTVSKPPPEKDPTDQLGDAIDEVAKGAPQKLVIAVAVGVGVLVLVNLWTATRGPTILTAARGR